MPDAEVEAARAARLQQQQRADAAGSGPSREEGERLAEKLREDIDRSKDVHVFTIAMMLAVGRDLSDLGLLALGGIGAIPILGVLLGWGITVLNWWFLTGNGWFKESEWQVRFLYWALAFFVDGLPLISGLPLNTIVVLYVWSDIQEKAGISSKKLAELQPKLAKRVRAA